MTWCLVFCVLSIYFTFKFKSTILNSTIILNIRIIVYVFASEICFQMNWMSPQILMSVQKMLTCVKMDSVWISLVLIIVSVKWDSLPPQTAGHAKVSNCYFKSVFSVYNGSCKANRKRCKDLNLEGDYSAHAVLALIVLKVGLICKLSSPGIPPQI